MMPWICRWTRPRRTWTRLLDDDSAFDFTDGDKADSDSGSDLELETDSAPEFEPEPEPEP